MKWIRRITVTVLCMAVIIGAGSLFTDGSDSGSSTAIVNDLTDISKAADMVVADSVTADKADGTESVDEMQVHFIDVGQGDCELVTCGGEAMLIDAGDNSRGTTIQLYLKKQGISSLKYVVGTHPDADHIGGMDVILYKFDCETLLMPDDFNDTKSWQDVVDVIDERGYKITVPAPGDTYSLGTAEFTILSPGRSYEEDNNNSLVLRLVNGDNSFLFTGDAQTEAEEDMISRKKTYPLQSDVLKIGHHGSSNATSQSFLNAVGPSYAVISCGIDNDYGHPKQDTLDKLKDAGVQVFRTDEQGTVIAISDGTDITWSTSPSQTWKAGETTEISLDDAAGSGLAAESAIVDRSVETSDTETSSETTYVLNNNSKKFHLPDCSSVDDMKEKNRQDVTWSRQECIDAGYQPCKRCKP